MILGIGLFVHITRDTLAICVLQELDMAFRRVRRRYVEARKASKVTPVIEELLKVIEGNGMSIQAWFEAMDQVAINDKVTQEELSMGMRILQDHHTDRKKLPVLTAEKVNVMEDQSTRFLQRPI